MAAHNYGPLFMASIATQSNSHRLGSHEAPPAVMSVFTGSTLSAILDSLEERLSDKKLTPDEKTEIKLDIGKIPEILLDNTDRNRTSPFAFTGNRFRIPGDRFVEQLRRAADSDQHGGRRTGSPYSKPKSTS